MNFSRLFQGHSRIISGHAARFNNSHVRGGWFVGMRCPYVCDPGANGIQCCVAPCTMKTLEFCEAAMDWLQPNLPLR